MTFLAQLYDCHSCYDERSMDPKKNAHLAQIHPWISSLSRLGGTNLRVIFFFTEEHRRFFLGIFVHILVTGYLWFYI